MIFQVRVCCTCKADVTELGQKICRACLDKRSAAKARNPVLRAKLIEHYRKYGSLYPATSRDAEIK